MGLFEQAETFTKVLSESYPKQLISVVLFGSVVRGEAKEDSDIDLLVVMKDLPPGRYVRKGVLEPVFEKISSEGCDAAFNCHLKTPDEAKKITVLYYDFPEEARLLYDQDRFFQKIIEETARHIKKTGAVRKRWGKYRYWDLRPGARADDIFEIL